MIAFVETIMPGEIKPLASIVDVGMLCVAVEAGLIPTDGGKLDQRGLTGSERLILDRNAPHIIPHLPKPLDSILALDKPI